jgi:hypothetical protein
VPWERKNLGHLFNSFIFFTAIFGFICVLNSFFNYFVILKENLLNNHIKEEEIFSTLNKILLYDIFLDNKELNNENGSIKSSNSMKSSFFEFELLITEYSQQDNLIYTELVKLLTPFFTLSIYYFFVILLFQKKHTLIYILIIFTIIFEFSYLKYFYNIVDINSGKYYEIIPIILLLTAYMLLILSKSKTLYFKQIYKNSPFTRVKELDKFFFLSFNLLIISGIVLLIYFFSECLLINFKSNNYITIYLVNMDINILHRLKIISISGFVLIIFGNTINFGDYLLYLLYRPIEKEHFPAELKSTHYKALIIRKSLMTQLLLQKPNSNYPE